MKNLIFFFKFFGLHQGLGLIMRLSVTGAWIFSFLSWLASWLGPDYEALGNESLNFGTLGWSCTRQLAIWMWNVWFLFSFVFWPASKHGPDYEALGNESLNFGTLGWSCTRHLALWMWNVWFPFSFFIGGHQRLGLIMKHLVTGAWILGLWVEAAPVRWPCQWEKLDFLFHVFWLASRLGLDYEALENEGLNFFIFFLASIKAWAWLWSSQ
jgi:hypothetical protein